MAEDAIEIIPQVDEGLHGHALMPSRSQAFDHFWKPDALRVTLRHGAPFYGGLVAADVLCRPPSALGPLIRRLQARFRADRSRPPELCLHLRMPLCRLDGDAAEQKLDLIEPDAGGCRPMSTAALTHPGTGIMRTVWRTVRRFRSKLFLIFSRHASCTGDCWCDTLLGALR